jgi:tripartite-type tricarboxylate transporter receptor subunit TctC
MMDKRTFLTTVGAGLVMAAGGIARAQSGGKPIRIVVPLPAGSSNDFVTRTIAPLVSVSLGQPVVIDNKAGANGIIGTMDVVRAAPDGLTLMVSSVSPLAVNLALYANVPYDPRRDLTPIAGVSLTNNVLLVKATHPARTFAEFIDHAKKNPRTVSVGSSTASTQLQLQTINRMAGIDMLIVPYKGSPATVTDVLGDTLTATLVDPGIALAQTRGGQMRALAVGSARRNPVTPDWPAMAETLPGLDFGIWNVMTGPAGMARDKVERISAAVADALRQKEVVDKYALSGTSPYVLGPDEVRNLLASEHDKWQKFARDANLKPEPIQ